MGDHKIEAEFRVGGRKFDGLPQAEAYKRMLEARDAAKASFESALVWGVSARSAVRLAEAFETSSIDMVMTMLGPLFAVLKARADWAELQARLDGLIGKRRK